MAASVKEIIGLDPFLGLQQRPAGALLDKFACVEFLVPRNASIGQSLDQFLYAGLCHCSGLVPVLRDQAVTVKLDARQFQFEITDSSLSFVVSVDQNLNMDPNLLDLLGRHVGSE